MISEHIKAVSEQKNIRRIRQLEKYRYYLSLSLSEEIKEELRWGFSEIYIINLYLKQNKNFIRKNSEIVTRFWGNMETAKLFQRTWIRGSFPLLDPLSLLPLVMQSDAAREINLSPGFLSSHIDVLLLYDRFRSYVASLAKRIPSTTASTVINHMSFHIRNNIYKFLLKRNCFLEMRKFYVYCIEYSRYMNWLTHAFSFVYGYNIFSYKPTVQNCQIK